MAAPPYPQGQFRPPYPPPGQPYPQPFPTGPGYRPPMPGAPPPGQFPAPQSLADRIYLEQFNDGQDPMAPPEEEKSTLGQQSVLLHPEEIPKGSKRLFAKKLYQSFLPCQRFMSLLLRFPIVSYENDDRTMVFAYNWHSCVGGLYFVTSALIAVLTAASCLSFIATMLNFPAQPEIKNVTWHIPVNNNQTTQWVQYFVKHHLPKKAVYNITANMTFDRKKLRAMEMFYFRRNMAPLLMIIFLLLHIVTADYNMYQRRHFVASYLTFWTDSVEIMQMDAAGDAQKFFKKIRCYYFFWFFVFFVSLVMNLTPVASGAPASFAVLWVRFFWPEISAENNFHITMLRVLGSIMSLYVILSSKVYVFFFLYISKLLANACTVWNTRLQTIFTDVERMKSRPERCIGRTGYDHLFKDYVNLLDLQEGADTLFTNIIESYFSMTIMSIVFEVYYLARPLYSTSGEFSGVRLLDMGLVALYLFNSLVILFLVSTGAAEVGAAFAEGLEIIRKQGILGHRSDPEMHLMISLYMSYTGHFDTALQGGGYFILDKPFFISIAGTMISYIIIIFQFQPALGLANEEQKTLLGVEDEYDRKVLLSHVENTNWMFKNYEPFLEKAGG